MREHFHFIDQGHGGNLRHHVTRRGSGVGSQKRRQPFVEIRIYQTLNAPLADSGEIHERNGRIVERKGYRRAVEISTGQNFFAVWEDQRIIGDAAGFSFDNFGGVPEHAAHRSVHLGHATKRIGILHAGIVFQVRLADLALAQQLAQMRGNFDLSGMWTRRVNPLVKSDRRIAQSFERHRPGDVGNLRESLRSMQRQTAHGRHRLRSVEQREPFLGFQLQWLDAGETHRGVAFHSFVR